MLWDQTWWITNKRVKNKVPRQNGGSFLHEVISYWSILSSYTKYWKHLNWGLRRSILKQQYEGHNICAKAHCRYVIPKSTLSLTNYVSKNGVEMRSALSNAGCAQRAIYAKRLAHRGISAAYPKRRATQLAILLCAFYQHETELLCVLSVVCVRSLV